MQIFRLILLSLIYLSIHINHRSLAAQIRKKQEYKRGNRGNAIKVSVYFGSLCGESSFFLEDQLQPVWNDLSEFDRIKVEMVPFGRGECVPQKGDYRCVCQHGPEECDLNQLMNCAMRYMGSPKKYMPLLFCIQGKTDLEDAEDECLTPMLTPSLREQLIECASGKEGRRLLKAAADKTAQVKPEIQFIPWVVLDGKPSLYAQRILLRMICQKLDPLPDVCNGDQGFWRR